MKLKEILEIEPGTLIKGLDITISGLATLSLNGWNVEQKQIIKNIWYDPKNLVFCFAYLKHEDISCYLERGEIGLQKDLNLQIKILENNGLIFHKENKRFLIRNIMKLFEGECVGMSLGESFVAIVPFKSEIYRPNQYTIILFHKILYLNDIVWVSLKTQKINLNIFSNNIKESILNNEMDLL